MMLAAFSQILLLIIIGGALFKDLVMSASLMCRKNFHRHIA